jgi:hypothetical protein
VWFYPDVESVEMLAEVKWLGLNAIPSAASADTG